MDGLFTYFKIGAIKAGAPADVVERFDGADVRDVIELYRDEIKLWISLGWPSAEVLVDNIGKELLAKYHVHADDDEFTDGGDSDSYIVCGNSGGEIRVGGMNSAVVYVMDNSEVLVEASGSGRVFVHVHDGAHVTVENHGRGRVMVKSHSSECDVLTSGDVAYIDGVANGTAEYVTLSDAERDAYMSKIMQK